MGKTTLLKQYMADLLQSGVSPGTIAYLPGEMIDDHHALVRLFSEFIDAAGAETTPLFFLLDEVTYISQWDRGIKYLADAGLLRNTLLVLTGSDTVVIRDASVRFPGRRGRADRVDFHLFPLTFAEYASLSTLPIRDTCLPAGRFVDSLPFSTAPASPVSPQKRTADWEKEDGNPVGRRGLYSAATLARSA